MAPVLGPCLVSKSPRRALGEYPAPPQKCSLNASTRFQVRVFWQTCNYWHGLQESQGQKTVVFLNCDESNVIMDAHNRSGVLVKGRNARVPFFTGENAISRGSFTILAWVSSAPEIQEELDQFIIVSKKLLSQVAYDELNSVRQHGVHLWRLESSWLNHHVFITCMRTLSRSLQRFRDKYNFVLVLDVASVHLQPDVLRAARLLRLPLVFLPRNSTWLMQPCDTHVFRKLKSRIRRLHHAAVLERRCLRMSLKDTCRFSMIAVQEVVRGNDWSRAFLKNGLVNYQRSVGLRLEKALDHSGDFEMPRTRPSEESVLSTLPRNRQKTPINLLLDPLRERPLPIDPPERIIMNAVEYERPVTRSMSRSLGTGDPPQVAEAAVISNPEMPSTPQQTTESLSDPNPWANRLRKRNDQNAAVCGSTIKRLKSQSLSPGGASSSHEPWQSKR